MNWKLKGCSYIWSTDVCYRCHDCCPICSERSKISSFFSDQLKKLASGEQSSRREPFNRSYRLVLQIHKDLYQITETTSFPTVAITKMFCTRRENNDMLTFHISLNKRSRRKHTSIIERMITVHLQSLILWKTMLIKIIYKFQLNVTVIFGQWMLNVSNMEMANFSPLP